MKATSLTPSSISLVLAVACPYIYIAYLSLFLDRTCLAPEPLQQPQQPQQQQQQLTPVEGSSTPAIAQLHLQISNLGSTITNLSSIIAQLKAGQPQAVSLPQAPGTSGVGCRCARGLGQKPADFPSFEEVLNNAASDKKNHKYGRPYAEYFDPIKYEKLAFLEIGLLGGGSIALWKSFFPNAKIYGIDKGQNHQGFMQHMGKEGIKIFIGDQANATFLREVRAAIEAESGALDFVIDDGGHSMVQQQTTLVELLPAVKPGGYFFIEDLETSYYPGCGYGCYGECCGGGPPGTPGTTINVIKGLIDTLNSDFVPGPNVQQKWGLHKHKVIDGDDLIGSIQCWRNMCVLRRKKDEWQ